MQVDFLSKLKINKLTQELYDAALALENINDNEFYITPVAKTLVVDTMLLASEWSNSVAPFAQTLSIDGVTATNINEITFANSCSDEQIKIYLSCGLRDGGLAEGSITLLATKKKPSIDIPVTVIVRKDL